MQLQKQPSRWSCLPTAFAMALDVPVEEIFDHIGHDGSEVIFPNLRSPYCQRSFHMQEMVDFCISRDLAVVEIHKIPVGESLDGHTFLLPVSDKRMDFYLLNYTGVLTGIGSHGHPHAVAWDKHKVLDPNGTTYSIREFEIETLYLIVKINITK